MLGCISVVKFVTKPGHSEDFVEICKQNEFRKINGLIEATLIQTDENKFTWISEFDDISKLVDAQDTFVAHLDTWRHLLENITIDNGVTDPESGQIVVRESQKILPGT